MYSANPERTEPASLLKRGAAAAAAAMLLAGASSLAWGNEQPQDPQDPAAGTDSSLSAVQNQSHNLNLSLSQNQSMGQEPVSGHERSPSAATPAPDAGLGTVSSGTREPAGASDLTASSGTADGSLRAPAEKSKVEEQRVVQGQDLSQILEPDKAQSQSQSQSQTQAQTQIQDQNNPPGLDQQTKVQGDQTPATRSTPAQSQEREHQPADTLTDAPGSVAPTDAPGSVAPTDASGSDTPPAPNTNPDSSTGMTAESASAPQPPERGNSDASSPQDRESVPAQTRKETISPATPVSWNITPGPVTRNDCIAPAAAAPAAPSCLTPGICQLPVPAEGSEPAEGASEAQDPGTGLLSFPGFYLIPDLLPGTPFPEDGSDNASADLVPQASGSQTSGTTSPAASDGISEKKNGSSGSPAGDQNDSAAITSAETSAETGESSYLRRIIAGLIFLAAGGGVLWVLFILLENRLSRRMQRELDRARKELRRLSSLDLTALATALEKNTELTTKLLESHDELIRLRKEAASGKEVAAGGSAPDSGKAAAAADQLQEQHEIVRIVADRLAFMKVTLSRMDPKIKGYKQLSKSATQIGDNLRARGYEIIDYLGMPYNEGMKVTASFITDEELEEGTRIITGVIKPQINYQDQMIQAAQITVSQNI